MGGQTAYLIYLGAIGIAAISYVLVAYRGRLGALIQQALVWGLIFMAAVTLYGFRDVTIQQIFPKQGEALSTGILRIDRALDGHFYVKLPVNGTPVQFVIDTGASDIVLNRKDAARVGIDTKNLMYFGRAQTANGVISTAGITLDRIVFAGVTDRNVAATVTRGDMGISLLGMSYLRRFARMEIVADRMILQR